MTANKKQDTSVKSEIKSVWSNVVWLFAIIVRIQGVLCVNEDDFSA